MNQFRAILEWTRVLGGAGLGFLLFWASGWADASMRGLLAVGYISSWAFAGYHLLTGYLWEGE